MCMCLLYSEKIGTEENEENPHSTSPSNTFSEKKKTRKYDRNRHKSLHRSNEGNISERKCCEVEKLPEIIENPTSCHNPEKRKLHVFRNSCIKKCWQTNEYHHKSCQTRHRPSTDIFESFLYGNILESIQKCENEKGVEEDHCNLHK